MQQKFYQSLVNYPLIFKLRSSTGGFNTFKKKYFYIKIKLKLFKTKFIFPFHHLRTLKFNPGRSKHFTWYFCIFTPSLSLCHRKSQKSVQTCLIRRHYHKQSKSMT